MGRERKRTKPFAGRSGSSTSGIPGPHTHRATPLTQIERIELKDYNAVQFAEWLEYWKQLQLEGWDVTVLVELAPPSKHAMALACKPRTDMHDYSFRDTTSGGWRSKPD